MGFVHFFIIVEISKFDSFRPLKSCGGRMNDSKKYTLTHCERLTQICVFNTVKLGTSASSP